VDWEETKFYEKYCRFAGRLKLKLPKSWEKTLRRYIEFSALQVKPYEVFSASILSFLLTIIFSFLVSFFIHDPLAQVIIFLLPIFSFYYVYSYPKFRSQVIRIQTGDEGIKIILYMVIYLRLYPNFEKALEFAAKNVKGPISSDMKKLIWEVKVGKCETIEKALATYMPKWAVWNEDFVRSLSLLRGVLVEPSEEERERILKKSLNYLLITTHRKMKEYVENISSSITILHMMGMLLPVIGLILFPMISLFLHETINPFYLAAGYTIFLPLSIYFFMNRILVKRPSAFLIPDISKHPDLPPPGTFSVKIGKKTLFIPILPLSILIGLLIMLFGIFHFLDLSTKLSTVPQTMKVEILKKEAEINLENLLSTFSITGGFATMALLYFHLNSFQRIKLRNAIKNIESEFQLTLFSLGNFLSEGYPIEIAIKKSLEEYKKLGLEKRPTFVFLSRILNNIRNLGMTFKRAVFDKRYGALHFTPSFLIEEIMRILSDASRIGSRFLGKIAKTIGSYLENLYSIETKIRELLEEVRSGIKLQASFVVPFICAMVGVLGIFILNMLKMLSCQLAAIEKNLGLSFLQESTLSLGSLFNELVGDFSKVMPMTVMQVIVGIYSVEMVILFCMLLNGIENGFDRVSRDYIISKILKKAVLIYLGTSFLALLFFHGLIITMIETAGGSFVC